MSNGLSRVNRTNRCPICNHGDWCMVGERYILCMRVESTMPKKLGSGETGWLHRINAENRPAIPQRAERPEPPKIDAAALMRQYHAETERSPQHPVERLAEGLGVSPDSLRSLGCAWAEEHHAFAFPMVNGEGKPCGIRLRSWGGAKWAVTGSHQGVFLPVTLNPEGVCLLAEGPTDTAACLTLGFASLGRPSCSGGMDTIRQLLKRLGVKRAAVLADIDDEQELEHGRNPGMAGAKMLQEALMIPTCILTVPAKDMRAFVKAGGTRKIIEEQLRTLTWRYPRKGME